jgi:hypothetical protein
VFAGGGRDRSWLLLVQRLKPPECCDFLSLCDTSNFMDFSILLSLTRIGVCHLQAYTTHVSFAWHNDCFPMAAGWPAWISCAVIRLAR